MKTKNTLSIIILFLFINTNSFGQLYGTYTIGKSGTENFSSITAAVNSVKNQGISNTVFFKISPGVYDEQLYIPYIMGTEVYSPVFFEAADGDSSSVLITFKPTIDSIAYTLAFENTRHIVFRNLSLGTDTTSGRIVEFGRGCLNIQLLNCQFIGLKDGDALVSSPSMNGAFNEYIMIKNNLFLNGSHGISLVQGGSMPDINTYIENNVFKNQAINGTYFNNHRAALIQGNTVINTINASGFCGIKLDNCSGSSKILKNKIFLSNIGINSFGIRLFKSSGTLGGEALIANNFLYQNTKDWSVGINITTSDYTNIYHNSVHITGYSTGSACISYIFGKYSTLKNNNFVNSANGYTILLTGAQNMVNDHNNHYFNGSYLGDFDGILMSDLAAWQTASQQGSGSLSVNPQFCSDSNLHSFGDSINQKGIYIPSLNFDIDGESRNNPPDIGADESSPFFYSIGPDIKACASDSIVIDAGAFDGYLWEDLSTNRYYTIHADENVQSSDSQIVKINNHGCWFNDTILTEFLPYPEFELESDTTFCLNKFTGHKIYGPSNYLSYLWSDNSQDSVLTLKKPSDTGYVQVHLTVVDTNGCSGSDTVLFHFIQCVGIQEINKLVELQIWPNPTQDIINIILKDQLIVDQLSIRVYNELGKEVMEKQLAHPTSSIDLSNQSNGIYILKLYQKNSLLGIYKAIKQ